MKRKLPAGKIARLFVAGATFDDLMLLYGCGRDAIADALRRHVRRVMT